MSPRTMATAGAMTEQLVIQENAPDPISVTSLTRATTVATAQTATPHGYVTGDYVTVAGAVPSGYNGKQKITVTGANTFTYPVSASLATPATGTITVVYVSDAQGGRKLGWNALTTIPAEVIPISAIERLEITKSVATEMAYRFRIRARPDITSAMRAIWTLSHPDGAPAHTLEIHGVLRDPNDRAFFILECGEVTA